MAEEYKYKAEFQSEFYYYRDNQLENIIKDKRRIFFANYRNFDGDMNLNQRKKILEKIEEDAVEKKETYDSIPEELIDEYIDLNWQKYKLEKQFEEKKQSLKQTYQNKHSEEVYQLHETALEDAIVNIEQLDSYDMKLKNFLLSELNFIESTSVFMGLGTWSTLWGIGHLLQNVNFEASQTALYGAIVGLLVAFISVPAITISDWFKWKKEYPKAVDVLKKAGVYDIIIQKLEVEKDIKYIEENGEKRR